MFVRVEINHRLATFFSLRSRVIIFVLVGQQQKKRLQMTTWASGGGPLLLRRGWMARGAETGASLYLLAHLRRPPLCVPVESDVFFKFPDESYLKIVPRTATQDERNRNFVLELLSLSVPLKEQNWLTEGKCRLR